MRVRIQRQSKRHYHPMWMFAEPRFLDQKVANLSSAMKGWQPLGHWSPDTGNGGLSWFGESRISPRCRERVIRAGYVVGWFGQATVD